MNIVDLVYRNARLYPDDTAFVEIQTCLKSENRNQLEAV